MSVNWSGTLGLSSGAQTIAGAKTFTSAVTIGSTTTTVITGSFIDSMRAAASGQFNFRAGNAVVNNGRYEIVPSTTTDGSTFSTYALSVGRGVVAIQAPDGSLGGALQFRYLAASGNYNWQISNGNATASAIELCPSTSTDGSTFSAPVFKAIASTGQVILQPTSTSAKLSINGSTVATGAATATMTNAPAGAAGNPDLWAQITYNGVDYVFPLWTP